MKTKLIIFKLIILFLCIDANAQIEMICGEELNGAPTPPYGIPHITDTEGEALRIAIIYVTFPDDDEIGYGYTIWDPPPNEFSPTQPYISLVDDTEGDPQEPSISRYSAYTLSDFFCEMSLGKFDVIGDEYKVILPEESTTYAEESTYVGIINNLVLNLADSQIDYSDYDNWSFNSSTQEWEYGSDGAVEMIVIVYRNVPNNSNQWFFNDPSIGGEANILTSAYLDGVNIQPGHGLYSSGVTVIAQLYNASHTLQLIEHEISHRWFWHHEVGFMPQSNTRTSYFYIPSEREEIGYLTNIPLVNSTSTIVLEDYIETGDVVKVQIPGTNDYYYIANHQRVSEYEGIAKGGKDCYTTNYTLQDPECETGKGIYVYRVGDGCSNFNEPVDVISAEGRYNWDIDRTVTVPAQPNHIWPTSSSWPIIIPTIGSRIYGRDEYRKSIHGGNHSVINDDPCSSGTNDFWISIDEKGDEYDAFAIGYDEIFSPYSNPSTITCEDDDNTELTISLSGESHGVITVKIYIDDDETALSELPPSKPKNLKVTKEYIATGKFNPKLTWDANIEPDFINEEDQGVYKILRGATTSCESEPTNYNLIQVVDYDVTQYIDESIDLYDAGAGSGHCEYDYLTIHYKIIAVDTNDDESLPSEKSIISGWQDPCAPEERPGLGEEVPKIFSLKQNYPNPFNPTTNIQFDLPKDGFVSLKIYDVSGRLVATLVNEFRNAGSYVAGFNGSHLSSGVYFYTIKAGSFEETKRMVLIK